MARRLGPWRSASAIRPEISTGWSRSAGTTSLATLDAPGRAGLRRRNANSLFELPSTEGRTRPSRLTTSVSILSAGADAPEPDVGHSVNLSRVLERRIGEPDCPPKENRCERARRR